jgi:hypothetical protein
MSAIDIHKDIESTLGADAIGYSTVTRNLRKTQVTHDTEQTPTMIEDESQRSIDAAILLALAEKTFAFVPRIASKTLIRRTAGYRHLVRPLCMTVKHLRWVPHRLPPRQKGSRV